jgi:F-type H+-transporting ATPase subunit gamma
MASLKQLRKRIHSVNSTQKITKAMQLVAANKLSKAQDAFSENIIVWDLMSRMLQNVLPVIKQDSLSKNDTQKILVLITADKGLCGAYNSSVIKHFKNTLLRSGKNDENLDIILIGKKGKVLQNHLNTASYNNIPQDYLDLADAVSVQIVEILNQHGGGSVTLCFNNYKNAMTYENTERQIWPVAAAKQDSNYEIEGVDFLDTLQLYFKVALVNSLLASNAAELSARMLAMDNATRNAESLIEKLTLSLNRNRQAMITKELIEIISGAEAL